MQAENLTIPVGKYDFIWAVHAHGPIKAEADSMPPLVVMIHGFPGDSRSYGNVFNDLSVQFIKDGLHTLRFDMRGCGESNKAAQFFTLRTGHEDCMAVLRWAKKTGYKRLYLIAEDLGAIIALTALTDAMRPQVKGLVLLWPILAPQDSWFGELQPMIDEAAANDEDHITASDTKIGLVLLNELRDYNLAPLMGRITMPTFVQHGTDDRKAPVGQLDLLLKHAGTARMEIVTFGGGEHGLKKPQERDQLLRETRAFFKKIAALA
ncbi:MAG: alpha/beta fold hydrolase [Micavibrio sp.]